VRERGREKERKREKERERETGGRGYIEALSVDLLLVRADRPFRSEGED
jgi:hypothetical protein